MHTSARTEHMRRVLRGLPPSSKNRGEKEGGPPHQVEFSSLDISEHIIISYFT